ncbi:radical SAM protein [Treponema pedis]|uniref:Radical SAM protein n=1 Tax=Treponema pedis TaxID=409322 RepID=A0A7S6WPM9_9SPIR|nr:radical SAM protein [Treponema pedis]QOW60942.1 radical SAM protein [Treponema pedis]
MSDINARDFIKFESINIDRAKDIATRYMAKQYGVSRVEVILTNRCQLNCVYCKKHLAVDYPEYCIPHSIMMKTLKQWFDHGCKFIHFTGGEVSLCSHIYEYVELAHKNGVEVTMSTNGVNTPTTYESLVKKGVNCFHISLDTYDKDIFDKQVGAKGAFEKVINTIHLITELRDKEHYKTKLVLNVCITPETFINLVDILHFMLSLKPDDIKLIPIAQLKNEWTNYERLYDDKIKPKLLQMLIDKNGFDMLKARINSLVKKSFRGYNNKKVVPPCYLSQDERTIDPEGNYYGCYINYREGASPIGNIRNDSFIIQSKKLRKNIHEFTQSEICQKYCADLTVLCNNYIDKQLDELIYDKCYFPNNENKLFYSENSKSYHLRKLFKAGYNIPNYIYGHL